MRKIPLLLALTVALGGCAVSSAHNPADPAPPSATAAPSSPNTATLQLANTHWQFVAVNGNAVPSGVKATLAFDASGHASGHAGCNSYGASYQSGADGSLRFGGVLSTKMACLQPDGAMLTERGVFNALRDTAKARRNGSSLTLTGASGSTLATLNSSP